MDMVLSLNRIADLADRQMDETMRDKADPADAALQGFETSVLGYTEAQLQLWVSACLEGGVQELDRMIATAPANVRMAYPCYGSMADEIEITVLRIWRDIAIKRMRSGH